MSIYMASDVNPSMSERLTVQYSLASQLVSLQVCCHCGVRQLLFTKLASCVFLGNFAMYSVAPKILPHTASRMLWMIVMIIRSAWLYPLVCFSHFCLLA